MSIGHAHIKVRDLNIAERFYRAALGLDVRERVADRFVFLSGTDMHHEIALQAVGPHANNPARSDVGLFHVAFEVSDKRALAECYQRLLEMSIRPVAVDHRISWAIYFSDPDGNGLEVYCDTREEVGVKLWEGVDVPLTHEQLLAEAEK